VDRLASSNTISTHETWRTVPDRSERNSACRRANSWSKHRITVDANILGQT